MIRPVRVQQAREALRAKGFVLSQKGNRDHEMYFFMLDGRKTSIHFKISHGAREVRRDEIRNSVKPMGIASDDIYQILCCSHDQAETRRLLEAALERSRE